MKGLAIALIVAGIACIGGIVSSFWPNVPMTAVLAIIYTVGIICSVPIMWGERRD